VPESVNAMHGIGKKSGRVNTWARSQAISVMGRYCCSNIATSLVHG